MILTLKLFFYRKIIDLFWLLLDLSWAQILLKKIRIHYQVIGTFFIDSLGLLVEILLKKTGLILLVIFIQSLILLRL
jgi:hypothetical protein